jgi:hypothetical protein
MSIQVVEVALSDLVPFSVSISSDSRVIYEHLKYYCSKFKPLPAIAVQLDGDRLRIVDRHAYASIARDLGVERIRAVLVGTTLEELEQKSIRNVPVLVPRETLDSELRCEAVAAWHVLFFGTVPAAEIVAEIDRRFRLFLKHSLAPLIGDEGSSDISSEFKPSGPCFEIRFPTPAENHRWATAFRGLLFGIHRELASIESYQGQRFEVESS